MAARSKNKSKTWQYWGYLVLGFLILSVLNESAGPAAIAIMMGLLAVWILFQAPAVCAANIRAARVGRVDFCRNNSSGLLLGCWLTQHKWQKFGQQWWSLSWREKTRGIWTGANAKVSTLGFAIGSLTGLFGLGKDLVEIIAK